MEKQKRVYGLIGYPVKHSLSPLMHNAAFKFLLEQKQIDYDAEYRLFEVKPQDLDSFFNSLSKQNIYGLNVTIPYKEKVLDFVKPDKESFYLRQVEAVNTIVIKDGTWKGFNTDIPGFSKHLKENIDPKNKKAAIIGAGGAARAVCYVLANSGVKEIAIFDIDKDKSQSVSNMIKNLFTNFKIFPVERLEELNIRNKDLLINATPVGLKEDDPCLIGEEVLHKNLFVYDLIYNPQETKLLKLAKKSGAGYANGLKMLLYQGTLSFEIWTGKKAPKEVMWKALCSQIP